MDYITHYQSPLGGITMATDGEALTGLWFVGQRHFPARLPSAGELSALPVFAQTARWLDLYFSGHIPDFTPKLTMRTTPFRKRVWEVMLTIPYGKTMTYGEIAQRIVDTRLDASLKSPRMSAQAVGGAVGHNSISLIIPCHRVIGADGSLTGYAGGLDKKVWLLQMERGNYS